MKFKTTTIVFIILLQSLIVNVNAFNAKDHKIAVLVNDNLITSYDVTQRMKLNAILGGINITNTNRNQFANKAIDELIREKLKNEKINEFNISVTNDEFLNQEIKFYMNNQLNKEDLINIFEINNVKYSEFKKYIIDEISWQKLISGMYYRLTSASEIEIEEITMKDPSLTKIEAKEIIVKRQLDLKSSKMIRDMFNEATIEYK